MITEIETRRDARNLFLSSKIKAAVEEYLPQKMK